MIVSILCSRSETLYQIWAFQIVIKYKRSPQHQRYYEYCARIWWLPIRHIDPARLWATTTTMTFWIAVCVNVMRL